MLARSTRGWFGWMAGPAWIARVCALVGFGLGAGPAAAAPVAVKQVAAPPADVLSGRLRTPEPDTTGIASRTALLPVEFTRDGSGWSWSAQLHITADGSLVIVPLQPDGVEGGVEPDAGWTLELVDPKGRRLALPGRDDPGLLDADAPVARLDAPLGVLAPGRTAPRFEVRAPEPGRWSLQVRSAGPAGGFVLVAPDENIELHTFVRSLRTVVGEPVVLQSELSDSGRIGSVTLDVRGPRGGLRRIHADAADGSVAFVPDRPGSHAARVEVRATRPDGTPVVLTIQHLIHIEPPAPAFTAARMEEGPGRLTIHLGPNRPGQKAIVAAEVWGRAGGVQVPVCWLARVCDAERVLTLDTRWVALAGVDPATLELRAVRAHAAGSMVLIAARDRIDIASPGLTLPASPGVVTPDMLRGRPGDAVINTNIMFPSPRATQPGHRLLLVHGYCSDGNPFTPAHFTGDIATFEDAGQNRSNDAFALELLAQGSVMKSFGVAAHSQGSMAALHLSTFYWSGLDWSQGERLIQSVGAPFQGTALAGNAAILGDIFGTGCGENADMTYTGAAQWLSLIPTWARSQVWYWTTSFTDRPFVYDYCNFFTDLLLSDPNDGVIERDAGQLPGAHNMGHAEGWCHTQGMRDPAQCTDAARNAQINLRARR